MSNNKTAGGIRQDFSLVGILLIPLSIAINIVGGQIITALKLPIFLDSVGTILAGALAGPWVGAVTGLAGNLINGIFDPSFIPYSIVAVAAGLAAGFLSGRGFFARPWKVAVSGVVIGLICTVIGTPITAYVYGGVTGSGNTFITGLLLATGRNLLTAVTTSVLLSNLADKILSAYIVYAVVRLIPSRLLVKFSLGSKYLTLSKKGASAASESDHSTVA